MARKIFVVYCESGHLWLVRAATEARAARDWEERVAEGNAEPAMGVGRPSRKEIKFLRKLGQADEDV